MIKNLARNDLKNFVPYQVNQVSHKIKMDANESPFDIPDSVKKKLAQFFAGDTGFNLYPDTDSIELRTTIANHYNKSIDEIVVGVGSDQLINMIINAFVEREQKVLYPYPSFGMYKDATIIAGGIPVKFDLNQEFDYDIEKLISTVKQETIKIVFLCTPNNPTGNVIPRSDIIKILENCQDSIVVIDEAYAEFSGETSMDLISYYDNLIILRTFSKAYSLAGIRCGYSISSTKVSYELNKVKPPYNLSSFSQMVAKLVLEEVQESIKNINYIIEQRDYLFSQMSKIKNIKVYPSKANFLLFSSKKSNNIYLELRKRGILVRNFENNEVLKNHLRVSAGSKEQNDIFIKELDNIMLNIFN